MTLFDICITLASSLCRRYYHIRGTFESRCVRSHAETCLQGAAEMVLRRCTKAVSTDGTVVPMSAPLRAELMDTTTGMAARGLRTLCITYRDFSAAGQRPADLFETAPDTELTCCAITGIKVLYRLFPALFSRLCAD